MKWIFPVKQANDDTVDIIMLRRESSLQSKRVAFDHECHTCGTGRHFCMVEHVKPTPSLDFVFSSWKRCPIMAFYLIYHLNNYAEIKCAAQPAEGGSNKPH